MFILCLTRDYIQCLAKQHLQPCSLWVSITDQTHPWILCSKWESCDSCFPQSVSLPPSSRPPLPPPPFFFWVFVLTLPYASSVFVFHSINSVMVMSGMCINSNLPYPCLPLPPLSPVGVSIHPCLFVLPLFPPYPSPPLTLNPRMAPITRTCWCVRVL